MRKIGYFHLFAVLAAAALALPVQGESAPSNPTYTRDIAPILFDHCVQCHRPGDIAPMSLMSYEEVRPWAKSIAEAVGNGVMPPWHADAGIGSFANDRSLADHEVETIVRWVNRGAKRGAPSDMPEAPEFDDEGWRLGTPDRVVTFRSVDLPAGGPDRFYDLEADPELSDDRWLRGVEVKPGNRKVTHHVILWQGSSGQQGWLGAWAAGMDPMAFPTGTGRLLEAGSTLVADMHYHPADTPETDRTQIGLFFAEDDEIEKELINLWIQNASFEIPAGDPDYRARASYVFPQDSYIHALLPHMHYRGKEFVYTARFPDGRKQKLLSVSDYDFNWQTAYSLEEPLFVPAGTLVDCVARWDNSADNPNNPDPTRAVRFGDESYDEMMIGFVDYTVKEGVRPPAPEEVVAQHARELVADHPGEVYIANVIPNDEQIYRGVAYLPRNRPAGAWHITLQGSLFDVPVEDLEWEGDSFTAEVTIIGQTFRFTGTVKADGTLDGNVTEITNDANAAPVRGERVEP